MDEDTLIVLLLVIGAIMSLLVTIAIVLIGIEILLYFFPGMSLVLRLGIVVVLLIVFTGCSFSVVITE